MRFARVAAMFATFGATAFGATVFGALAAGLGASTAGAWTASPPVGNPMTGGAEPGVGGAAAAPGGNLYVSPSSGPPGTPFTISFSNFARNCPQIQFFWDGQGLASLPGQMRGSVRVTVPAAAGTGTHVVSGRACASSGSDQFVVTAIPRVTTASRSVGPTSTAPRTSSQESASGPETTTAFDPLSTTATTATSTGRYRLIFDKVAIQAGEPLSASGAGCDPNTPVTLTANGEQVGATTADDAGSFSTPVVFSMLKPGRQAVTATCGGVVLTGGVDLILITSSSGSTGVLVVLVLVLLAGVTLVAHYRTKTRW